MTIVPFPHAPSRCLSKFNATLDARPIYAWNEAQLVERSEGLSVLEASTADEGTAPLLDLSRARLTELALLCAGRYADGACFVPAGNLLVNPRQVDIHLKGGARALAKGRHERLSDVLAVGGAPAYRAAWLAVNTISRVRRKALLPNLYHRLAASEALADTYLVSVAERMRQVAATLSLLAAWQIRDEGDLCRRLEMATPGDRALLEAGLCRFEPNRFHELGRILTRLLSSADGTGGKFFASRYANVDTTPPAMHSAAGMTGMKGVADS